MSCLRLGCVPSISSNPHHHRLHSVFVDGESARCWIENTLSYQLVLVLQNHRTYACSIVRLIDNFCHSFAIAGSDKLFKHGSHQKSEQSHKKYFQRSIDPQCVQASISKLRLFNLASLRARSIFALATAWLQLLLLLLHEMTCVIHNCMFILG